jgi:hypothetical protein
MAEETQSDNLRDLEQHAEEQGADHGSEGGEKPDDPDEVSTATEVMAADEDPDPGEQMRPAGEPVERIDGGGEMKRIDEDVKGHEETEDMSDVEAGDGEAPSS